MPQHDTDIEAFSKLVTSQQSVEDNSKAFQETVLSQKHNNSDAAFHEIGESRTRSSQTLWLLI